MSDPRQPVKGAPPLDNGLQPTIRPANQAQLWAGAAIRPASCPGPAVRSAPCADDGPTRWDVATPNKIGPRCWRRGWISGGSLATSARRAPSLPVEVQAAAGRPPKPRQEQGEVASSELTRPPLVAKTERRDLFEDQRQVVDLDVPQATLCFGSLDKPRVEVLRARDRPSRSSSWRERPGEVDRDREDIRIEDPLHEGRERRPCVAGVGHGNLGLSEVSTEAVARQLTEQVLLARIPAIERTDPDPGARGRPRWALQGRRGIPPSRLEDARVVSARLSLAPAQPALDVVLHLDSIA